MGPENYSYPKIKEAKGGNHEATEKGLEGNIEKPEATYAENGKDCQSRRKA
jgi:hypothetical protein